jgi:hypothetical protein
MNLRKEIRRVLKEEAAAKIFPMRKIDIEGLTQMSPEQFSKLSPEEISEILNEILPSMEQLEKQTKQLEWIFDQLKEQRLLSEAKKFKDNTLRYKNVLITLMQQSYADPRTILKRLEQENPKIIKLVEKIKSEETRTIDKIRKAYSTSRIRPKGYPDKPEKVVVEANLKGFIIKSWDAIKSAGRKITEVVYDIWTVIFDDINNEIDDMIDEVERIKAKSKKNIRVNRDE